MNYELRRKTAKKLNGPTKPVAPNTLESMVLLTALPQFECWMRAWELAQDSRFRPPDNCGALEPIRHRAGAKAGGYLNSSERGFKSPAGVSPRRSKQRLPSLARLGRRHTQ